jgi:hypothetical protein
MAAEVTVIGCQQRLDRLLSHLLRLKTGLGSLAATPGPPKSLSR